MKRLAKPSKDSTSNELVPWKLEKEKLLEMIRKLVEENHIQSQRIAKLEGKVLSLRNERTAFEQWLGWLRGHVAASGIFAQPGWMAETAWKNPPKSWRENGEGGKIVPHGLPVKQFSGNNSAFFTPDDERPL